MIASQGTVAARVYHKSSVENPAASLLVVDDLETSRNLIAGVLRKQHYQVDLAATGEQALSMVSELEFDMLLLDSRMPQMTGLEVLRRLRETHTAAALPVIMVTLKSDSDDVVAALDLGANDYVTKPVDFPVLFARIEAQLARRRAELAICQARSDLERRVQERTKELRATNTILSREIAERKRAEIAMRAGERRYRTLYDETPAMFFTLKVDGTVLSVNRFGAEHIGYDVAELVGQSVFTLFRAEDRADQQARLVACLRKPDSVHRWETCKLHKDGRPLWVRESARATTDATGGDSVLLVCEDISEAHFLSQQLSHQASHDDLTGLINRREFERRLQRILKTAREDPSEHALCYLDLDQFKVINDTCGHAAGDDLLRQLADFLQKKIRQRDTLARLGGDEFGVLLEHCSLAQARRVAHELRETIKQFEFSYAGSTYGIGASIGLVPITAASEDLTSVLSAADSACYIAKDAGRNRVHEFHAKDALTVRRHDELQRVMQLERALQRGELRLFYQPIVPLSPEVGRGLHYELLVRLRGEHGETIEPGSFLPTAERFNLVPKLDRWVLTAALDWLTQHPNHLDRTFACNINLSGLSLVDDEFCAAILRQFDATGVPPGKICFEITETAAIANMSKATRFMVALKARGCRFALDDFGSGLSSFAYLKNLPVDFLKIDGVFVKDICDDPTDLEMVRSINGIGHVMGKETIAEFVESEAILAKLREIGVDYAQGYGIGMPRPLDELAD